MEEDKINFFAQLNYRGNKDSFGIKIDDRRRHMYVIGKTGMGKTVMLQNMAIQDIKSGAGLGVVDPHGEFAEALLDHIPKERIKDVVYFNPADYEHPTGFNVLENVNFDQRHLVASGLMGVFKKLWPDVWSARMEYILNNAILALLEYPDATLLGVNRMFSTPNYRKDVVDHITDPVVKAFWTQEYANYTQRLEVEATASIQNKVGQFISAPLIRNIVGQVKSTVDIRELMDNKKILIANLSKGKIGEDNARLLGSMLMTKIYLAAMSRVDIPEEARQDFFLYVDEFQNFQSKAFADVLSEARKYRLSLILAHQYITQMDEEVQDAVFGNVGTIISFRIGAQDAEALEKEFAPEFELEDFVNLGKYNIILKLMIDGLASRGFASITLPPIMSEYASHRSEVITNSREQFTSHRADVEAYINKWHDDLATIGKGKQDSASSDTQKSEAAQRDKEIELYEATCADCGKRTMVPFKPDGERPIYCKKCRKKHLEGKHANPRTGAHRAEPKTNPPAVVEEHKGTSQAATSGEKPEVNIAGLRDSLKEFIPPQSEAAESPAEEKDDKSSS